MCKGHKKEKGWVIDFNFLTRKLTQNRFSNLQWIKRKKTLDHSKSGANVSSSKWINIWEDLLLEIAINFQKINWF